MSSASNRTPVDFPTRKGMHIGVLRTNKCAYYIIGLIHYVLYKDTIFRKQGGIMSKKEPLEVIEQIELTKLHPFPDHPFGVRDDDSMQQTVESIREYGVLVPAIARPREDGGYELIAGLRR